MVEVRVFAELVVCLRTCMSEEVQPMASRSSRPRTILTTGNTHGFALLSRYAPMPKSTFFGSVSRRYAAISPNIGSSGPCGTTSEVNAVALALPLIEPICAFTCRNRFAVRTCDCEVGLLDMFPLSLKAQINILVTPPGSRHVHVPIYYRLGRFTLPMRLGSDPSEMK